VVLVVFLALVGVAQRNQNSLIHLFYVIIVICSLLIFDRVLVSSEEAIAMIIIFIALLFLSSGSFKIFRGWRERS